MTDLSWTPQKLGIPSRQNRHLWKDIELAYQFVEAYAPFSISGDLESFLFELLRRRWNLACSDFYQPPPYVAQSLQSVEGSDLFPSEPQGLSLGKVDKLKLSANFVEQFKAYVSNCAKHQNKETATQLYGYGTDGFGTYIPLHLLWPKLKSYWGIYISEVGVLRLAVNLYWLASGQMKLFTENEPVYINTIIQIAYQAILRHLLFHFKIEQWALIFELANGSPYYLPYLQDVYLPTMYDPEDKNLEEALANLSILLSDKIQRIEKEGNLFASEAIESCFLSQQGPNYRNYKLMKGVPLDFERWDREIRYRQVVNYLCNQIVRHEICPAKPLVPYYLYPPNNNFLRAEDLCPIYLVNNLPPGVGVIA